MKLADVSINRPVFATMMIAALVVLGLFSFARLGLDLFPNVDFPFVVVTTTLRGAGSEEIETSITKPLEEAINTISGIEELKSSSLEGISQVMVMFDLDKNSDVSAQEVRDAVSRVIRQFPLGTDQPVVQKFDPGASPIMSIAVYGERLLRDLTQIAKKKIKEPLETLKGVGRITVVGGREREIHVIVNPLKLGSYNLSINQVKDALQQQNIEIPGGRVDRGRQEWVLRTMGRIETPGDFEKVVIANVRGVPVRIRDVGRAEDTEEEARTLARLDGKPTLSLIVQKQSGMNTVETIDRVKEELNVLKKDLPAGVTAEVVRDQSGFILSSVHNVEEHLFLGAILASLAVLLFIGNWRSTLIASLAIPASIITTFVFMDLAGFTLNIMTLLGLTLAVGIVIDDAIVVLENITRHVEEKKTPPMKAAFEATKEIGLAVMATTSSLVIIFLPLAYMGGIVGRFLRSFGLTIAFSILVSLFVAFTLTPMLCSRFLKHQEGRKSRLQEKVDKLNDALKERYGRLILWAMAHRKRVVIFSLLTALSTILWFSWIGKDFLPPDDTGEFQVQFKAPEGTSLTMTDEILKQIELEVRRLPGIESIMASIGEGESKSVNDGLLYIRMRPYSKRRLGQFEVMKMARHALAKYTGLRLSVTKVDMIGGTGFPTYDFSYVLTGPDLNQLAHYASSIVKGLKEVPGIVDVDTSLNLAKPELRVKINRDRAQDLGVKVEDIAQSLRTMVGGEEDITKFKEGDELYQVRLRVDKNYRNSPEVLSALLLPASKAGLVRLDNVASLVTEKGPSQIDRQDRQRQITIFANMEGIPMNRVIDKADEIARKLKMPVGYKTLLQAEGKEFGRMMQGFMMAFMLSFIFMYMILASQFDSFLHPITILLSLPLAIPFALFSLWITHQHLTIFSIMGVFMLFGIVKKNAILQVDYTNTLRRQGRPRDEAILEANKTRLRPILMTTSVLVAAMIPVMLGRGPGAANRATMAVVIVGGQTLCLLITLLLTPVAYSLFDDLTQWIKERFLNK
ncbi:MAG: efflux RND transporter permease subunit [Elusimicrobia bacterium]|nr:efflux RND transporter permease subunit [Candidatus Obscuribacterium magneticum]